MQKRVSIILLFCLSGLLKESRLLGQIKQIDSLMQILKTAKEDTCKINALNLLSEKAGWRISKYDTALVLAEQALTLSQSLPSPKGLRGAAYAYTNMGNVYICQGNYPLAIKMHFASLEINKKIDNKPGIASSYNNLAIIYADQGNYPEALKMHFVSLHIYETIGNKLGIASSHNNLGNIYLDLGNYPEALKNYKIALEMNKEIGNKAGVGDSYNNIGIFYADQGNYEEAIKNYTSTLKINEEIGNKKGVAFFYNNIGNICGAKGDYAEALKNYFACLKIKEEIGDKPGITLSYNNIGEIYGKQNKHAEAKIWLQRGLALAKEIGSPDHISSSYNCLAIADSALGNYKEALKNYKLYIAYSDSLINEENTKKMVQHQMQYEFDKKESAAKADQEKKDAITEADAKRHKIILYSVSGFGFLVLVLALVVFRSLRINQHKNKIIMHQKELVEKQKEMVEQKQKEILDSIHYAKRIQLALLPSEKYIKRNLKTVASLLLCLCSCFSYAQDADSLLREYSTYPDDTAKVSLLFKKGFAQRNNDLSVAIKFSEACCRIAEVVKDHRYIAKALNFRATLKAQTGFYDSAAVDLERALLLAIQTRDTLSQVVTLNNLGNVYTELNNTHKADVCFNNALKLAAEIENDYWVKGNLLGIATLQLKLKMFQQAEGNFMTLSQICNFTGEQEIISICDLNMGRCKLYNGDTIAAEAYELQALDELQMMDDTLGQCDAYANLAEIYLAKNNLKTCLDYAEKALSIAQKNNYSEGLLQAWKVLAAYYKLTGNNKESRFYSEKHDSALAVNAEPRHDNYLWNEGKNKKVQAEFVSQSSFWKTVSLGLLILILAIVIIPQNYGQKE